MIRTLPLLAALAVLATPAAFAHGALVSSQPAQASVLQAPPEVIELNFNENIRLTALTVESMDGSSHKVESVPAAAQAKFVLPAPAALPAGRHEIRWRGIGTDGHVVNGVVRFSIAR